MRIGLIGFGFIGSEIHRRIAREGGPLSLAFIHNRSRDRLAGIDPALILDDLADARLFAPDLIVEIAGPDVTVRHGEDLLALADYMPLSLTALADDALRMRLTDRARQAGHSLFVAHGALVGADSLLEWRAMWDHVSITFRKPPRSLGPAGDGIACETVIFDGTVRQIARQFPHNVNAMVACALAATGLDACHARLIADPALDRLELLIEATGKDGSYLKIERSQPAVGVSGSEMAEAVYRSILRAAGCAGTMEFV